ncbi:MAG: hypothetical protein KW788_02535 [Candidatus Doudnabacteria bacterium]|nr:hypothetical protein [Candidatus Doudnabacteria bacterium]
MKYLEAFWLWYKQHYLFALTITTFLFLLQLFHLYWLFTDVVLRKITGQSFFIFPPFWGALSTVLDYTEIPALISTSVIYIHQLRQGTGKKGWLYLFLLNIQWLHLFWITDQVVVERLGAHAYFHWAAIVAWIAILIDYGELPVMYDTARQTAAEWKKYLSQNKNAL